MVVVLDLEQLTVVLEKLKLLEGEQILVTSMQQVEITTRE